MWGMQLEQHTTSCGSGNSLFTGGGVEDTLLASPWMGAGFLCSLCRPSFIALDIYAPPQHLVITSMRHGVMEGPEEPRHKERWCYSGAREHLRGTICPYGASSASSNASLRKFSRTPSPT
jgi:hypothetical protein